MLAFIYFLLLFSNFTIRIKTSAETNGQSSHLKSVRFIEPFGINFFKYDIRNISLISKININNDSCLSELAAIRKGLDPKNPELWALKFPDSWGKIPSGILIGHTTDLGNFDECVEISQIIDEKCNQILQGKYCFAEIPFNDILKGIIPEKFNISESNLKVEKDLNGLGNLKLGICFPKTCSSEIVDDILRSLLEELEIHLDSNRPIIQSQTCKTKLIPNYRTVDIVAIFFFSFIGILMLLSSIYDYKISSNKQQPIKIFKAFSILTNGSKLFKIEKIKKSDPNIIECINGIQSLSIIWVVLCHQYDAAKLINNVNQDYIIEWYKTPFALLLTNGVLAVDSFFHTSGCLLIWITFKMMEKSNGNLNIFKMYLRRYLRLTPILAAFVLFQASLYKYIGSGPFWDVNKLEEYCHDKWWATLLYVSNYVDPNKMCYRPSWYTSVDMQFFLISPLYLIPLWKWGKIAFLPIIITILASIGYVFGEWIFREYHYLPLENNEKDFTKQNYTYYATHARISPYLIGIILGFFIYRYRNKTIKCSKLLIMLGWIFSLTLLSVLLFGPYHRSSLQPESGMTIFEGAAYESLSRLSWAIALSWIIFACHHDFGGIINKILTFGLWQPLARLAYGIYLTHDMVQLYWYGNYRIEHHFSDKDLIFIFWGCFGVTLSIAFVVVLAFEAPIIALENYICHSNNKRSINKFGSCGVKKENSDFERVTTHL